MYINTRQKSLQTLKQLCKEAPSQALLESIKEDERKGARELARRLEKELAKVENNRQQLNTMWQAEQELKQAQGTEFIIGVDEAGRGPLAGPVVVCALICTGELMNELKKQAYRLDDSKKLTQEEREKLYQFISQITPYYVIEAISPSDIDRNNIIQATYQGMTNAVDKLLHLWSGNGAYTREALGVAIDGNTCPPSFSKSNTTTVPGGDSKVASIAAASVMAKVYRDQIMTAYHQKYPWYNFANNKGYGTAEHLEALREKGPSPIHRKSFLTFQAEISASGQINSIDPGDHHCE